MRTEDLQALDYEGLHEVWRHEKRCLDAAQTAAALARSEKRFYQRRVREIEAEMARRERGGNQN